MMRCWLPVLGLALLSASATHLCGQISDLGIRSEPLSPDQSTEQIQLAPGYQLKRIANEPDVISPVDAAFDSRGRLWVVEMIDYPFIKPDQAEPRGRIRILSDDDGDGRFEQSAIFAERLNMPTGLGLWRDGAVVTVAGQLVWMRDTDQDGVADKFEVWLEGFAEQNEQLRANHPRLELDGTWTIANGLRGGKIQVGEALRGQAPAEPFELGTRDVRLDPRTGHLEAITGPAQFGLTTDMVGTRMFCTNRNPCVQVVLEQSLLADNPLAGIIPAVQDALPAGDDSRVYPLVAAWTTSNLHAGQFTAACGVYFQHIAAHSAMPDELVKRIHRETLGRVYVCEPTGSLVKMEQVDHAGPLWKVSAPEPDQRDSTEKGEWLASRDPWFRPVNIIAAPGSGVVVIDMQRAVIEHPAWVPDELKNRPDERFGELAGRLYWTAPETAGSVWPSPLLAQLREKPLDQRESHELVELLNSEDAWLQRTAARLLIERDAVDTVPKLLKLIDIKGDAAPEAQVIALRLLSQFDPAVRSHLLADLPQRHRLIQIASLRLLSQQPVPQPEGSDPLTVEATKMALLLAASTADPWLRLEAVMSAAHMVESMPPEDARAAAEALGKIAASQPDDPYLLVASASAARQSPSRFLLNWLDGLGELKPHDPLGRVGIAGRDRWIATAARQLVKSVEQREPQELPSLIARVRYLMTEADPVSDISRLAALSGLHQYARQSIKSKPPSAPPSTNSNVVPDALSAVDRPLWRKIRETARLPEVALPVRMAAIELLGLSQRRGDRELLTTLSMETPDGPLRTASIKAWCEQGSAPADEFILAQIGSAGPALRPVLIEQLLARTERQVALLRMLQTGTVTARQLGAVELKRFVDRSQGETKAGYQAQLDSILNSNRATVLTQYQGALELAGDVARGKEVFAKQCAACHRIGQLGVQVGPDISDSRVHSADKLLTNILDPNRAIDNNYFRFVVLTTDGRTLDGIIAEETADKIVLRSQNDQRHLINRSDIEQLKPTGVSMMPEGLESQIDPQAMADLIAFIKNWRYTDGQVPSTVKAGK